MIHSTAVWYSPTTSLPMLWSWSSSPFEPLPVVLTPRRARAVEPLGRHNAITKIARRRSVVHRVQNVHPLDDHARTRRRSAALQLGDDVRGGRAGPVPDGQVADVEGARVAVARGRVVARALRQGEDARDVDELEVLEGDVCGVAEAAAAAVGRVARAVAGPGLDVGAVAHLVVDGDVADGDVLYGLEGALF